MALVVGACATAQTPGWTYGPMLSLSPAASAEASAGASIPAAESAPASAGASAGPSAGGAALQVTAKNIAFSPGDFTGPADVGFTVHFDNQDSGVPHDVAILRGGPSGTSVFQGNIITGVATTDYQVPALPAGSYTIICIVHPTQMTATLTIK